MWNAGLYEKFGKERLQPSIDLLNRIRGRECKRIIDIGCGSGMSTLPLHSAYPEAAITGIDWSLEMLKKAEEMDASIEWKRRDCGKPIDDLGQFDLIFSNAFLQWLPDQETFLENTRNLLEENGVLAMQIPDFESMPVCGAIQRAVSLFLKGEGRGLLFDGIEKENCMNYSIGTYYDIFSRYYKKTEVFQVYYYHQMKNIQSIVDFVRGTALIPYLGRIKKSGLPESAEKEFLSLVYGQIEKIYKPQENGTILFEFKRMFFIAEGRN